MKNRWAAVVIGVTTLFGTPAAAADATLEVLDQGRHAVLAGPVEPGLSERILALPPSVTTLVVFSHGGNLFEARKAADILRTRGITTYAMNTCDSACVILFAGGVRRVAGSNVHFLVHGGITPVEKRTVAWKPEWDAAANVETGRLLLRLGIDPRLTEFLKLPREGHERTITAQEAVAYRLATEVGHVVWYESPEPPLPPWRVPPDPPRPVGFPQPPTK